jgi:hypothetical protein
MNDRLGFRRWSVILFAAACGVMTLGAAALAADAPIPAPPPPGNAAAIPSATADQGASGSVTPAGASVGAVPDGPAKPGSASGRDAAPTQTVSLRVDGNLAGRVTMLDPSGQPVPVRVRIVLVRGGRVVASARSDEIGAFQILRISPGVYSMIAAGREGFAALTIVVVAFDGSADGDGNGVDDLLNVSLIPFSDYQLGAALMGEEAPEEAVPPITAVPMTAPPVYGGGGGGEGGGAALAGLAGLAGLGGIGGGAGGGGGRPASSNTP